MKVFKGILSVFLRVAVSCLVLLVLFKQVDKESLIKIIKNVDPRLLIFACLVFLGNYILCIWRWKMLLKADMLNLPLQRIIISFSGGLFFSLFLPSTIGGDLIRSIDLAAHTKKPKEVVATVLLDRLSGYIGLVVMVLLALLLGWRHIRDASVIFSVVIITGVLIAVLLVLFNTPLYSRVNKILYSPRLDTPGVPSALDKVREAIQGLHKEIYYFKQHKNVILNNLLLSLVIQVISPLSFYIVSLALGIKINIIYYFLFVPIITAITLIPISMGGLGLRDATTIFFFAKVGVSKDLAFAMSLINFLFILAYSGIGGLIYVFTLHHRRIQSPQARQIPTQP